MRLVVGLVLVAACKPEPPAQLADAPPVGDAAAIDAPDPIDALPASKLGTVTNVVDLPACPIATPAGATCKRVTVAGCPQLETEALDATIAIIDPRVAAAKGTVVHLSGGGGDSFRVGNVAAYQQAGFRNVIVAWAKDWEQTQALGLRAAGCRPATLLAWIFDEPALHNASRTAAFCGEGFSGGAGQLGYALAHYGIGDYLDYVNELSGPPFARIDLGCDGDAPPTADVCGARVTMQLPRKLDEWENIPSPLFCGAKNVPAAELERWRADSIASGGVYDYPKTRVRFFACTYQATAVTAQGRLYYDLIAAAAGNDTTRAGYTCYTQADGCQGESLGTGNREAVAALIEGCTPRH